MIPQHQSPEDQLNECKKRFAEFLHTFSKHGRHVYVESAKQLLHSNNKTMVISMRDLNSFSAEFSESIMHGYHRVEPCLNDTLAAFVKDIDRTQHMQEERGVGRELGEDKYYVAFSNIYPENLRSLKCSLLGTLICLRATVTRTSEVRPELTMGVFKCKACDQKSSKIVQHFKFTEPKKCKTVNCDNNRFELVNEECEFSDYQKLRVQEDPMVIPPGSMPRSLDVILRNDTVEKAQPGDICQFFGQLAVVPDIVSMVKPGDRTQVLTKNTENRGNTVGMEGVTGLKQTGVRDINYKLVFICNWVEVDNNQFSTDNEKKQEDEENELEEEMGLAGYSDEKEMARITKSINPSQHQKLLEMKKNPNIFEALAESLFPAIYGNIEIKKAILLQLLSGVHKTTETGLNIRGDLNVLIVGDPSTAKSQFLKCVQQFMPRSVYTSGKTTSAAGLTATVTRDENGDVGIEAGALMLADNGVCCIDEFDKMDTKDQVAIHEAMEQQTISIAKAGIYATLNARTSILAAANPIFGRYDKTKSLRHNINLSTPIMSRFDLFFVICDESNELKDRHVGDFILNMHRNKESALDIIYETAIIREYMKLAKKIKPRLTHEAALKLREFYEKLRQNDKITQNTSYRVTVRQLESIIRLSEAIARLYMEPQVKPEYVQLAYNLLSCSIMKVEKEAIELEDDEEIAKQIGGLSLLDQSAPNLMEQQIINRQKEKKKEPLKMTHDVYAQMQRNVLELFKTREQEYLKNPDVRSDEPFSLVQNDIVDFLCAQSIGNLNTEEEMRRFRKIVTAALKRMNEVDRILVISRDSEVPAERTFVVHPNYTE